MLVELTAQPALAQFEAGLAGVASRYCAAAVRLIALGMEYDGPGLR